MNCLNLSGKATLIGGEWILVRWTIKPGAGVKLDIDKRCHKCNQAPAPNALAWVNLKQPTVYCHGCFQP